MTAVRTCGCDQQQQRQQQQQQQQQEQQQQQQQQREAGGVHLQMRPLISPRLAASVGTSETRDPGRVLQTPVVRPRGALDCTAPSQSRDSRDHKYLPLLSRNVFVCSVVAQCCVCGVLSRVSASASTAVCSSRRCLWSFSLSMPVCVPQQAHRRRVRGRHTQHSVLKPCGTCCYVFASSCRGWLTVPDHFLDQLVRVYT